jgi:hypothetical protein
MERTRHRCGAAVWAGQSGGGRLLALDVVLDPAPLDAAGELRALHDGRRTWTMHPRRDALGDVFARTAAVIRVRPAVLGQWQTVHADHVCQGEDA